MGSSIIGRLAPAHCHLDSSNSSNCENVDPSTNTLTDIAAKGMICMPVCDNFGTTVGELQVQIATGITLITLYCCQDQLCMPQC